MRKPKRKTVNRSEELELMSGANHPEHEAGELTEHAARQPLTDGVATVQVNYGTINFHIYR